MNCHFFTTEGIKYICSAQFYVKIKSIFCTDDPVLEDVKIKSDKEKYEWLIHGHVDQIFKR